MDRECGEQREVCEKSDDPRRRGHVEDPVVRGRVGRVHAGDREPLGLLIARVGDREVLEADPEERMVEKHLERRLIEEDAVTQSDPASDVEQAATEGRRDQHDYEGGGRDGGGQRKPN